MRRGLVGMAGAILLFATQAPAQIDALSAASLHCNDRSLPAEKRLASCARIVHAQGIGSDEVAFAYLDMGGAYEDARDYDSALAAYNKSLAIQPKLWEALMSRAYLQLRRSDIDSALADYRSAVASGTDGVSLDQPDVGYYRPERAGETYDTASLKRNQTIHDEAMTRLRNAVAGALSNRCAARAATDTTGALGDCNAALDLVPAFPPALAARGFLDFVRGDYRACVADLDGIPADFANAIYLRGVARHRLGDKAQGDADIAAAEKSKPGITAAMAAHGLSP